MKTTAIAAVLASAGMVFCNTEIVKLPRSPALELPVKPSLNWPIISSLPGHNSGLFEIHPIALDDGHKNSSMSLPHDLWLVLEIEEWSTENASPNAFTLRLSWPASMTVDFDVSIFRPSAPQAVPESRVNPAVPQYARLRAYSMAFRVPRDSAGPIIDDNNTVQFNVILEPLLWGVIPRSIVPTLSFLFAVVSLSVWVVVPRVLSCLEHVAEKARVEANKKHH